jgi:alpha-glucosidase
MMTMTRWQHVNGIYQIYPRSFKDSNEDGVGDLAGITEKLKYIKGDPDSLGIDAIWISPFYRSPMADFGYDVSDYFSVDPLFGDMEDFKNLLDEAHGREIKVMIDYVPNHTSDEHSWFIASRSSRENEKRQWYIWRDPAPDGGPPNNWQSVFGGSAWQLDEHTGQYYMHSFLAKQPDLNWENPEVRKAMTDVLDFWLSMGVDGIRADAVRWMSKDLEFRDNPPNPDFKEGDDPYSRYLPRYSRYGPKLFDYLKEIAATIERYPDRIILFEDYVDPNIGKQEQYTHFYSVNRAVAAPFNFEGLLAEYSTDEFRLLVNEFQMLMQGQLRPFYCFGNHDKPRLASRVGLAQARLVAMLQLTLPGIPVVYYGDELGMHDVTIPADKVQDPFEMQTPGLGLGRDPGRTPMQWSGEANAGFSTASPWLPVGDDYRDINVAVETNEPHSTLSLYRSLLKFRQSSTTLKSGKYVEWADSDNKVFGYIRQSSDEALLILLNMSDMTIDCVHDVNGEVIYSTHPFVAVKIEGCIVLRPHQGVIIRRAVVQA